MGEVIDMADFDWENRNKRSSTIEIHMTATDPDSIWKQLHDARKESIRNQGATVKLIMSNNFIIFVYPNSVLRLLYEQCLEKINSRIIGEKAVQSFVVRQPQFHTGRTNLKIVHDKLP